MIEIDDYEYKDVFRDLQTLKPGEKMTVYCKTTKAGRGTMWDLRRLLYRHEIGQHYKVYMKGGDVKIERRED